MKKLILPVLAVMAMGTASAQFNLGISAGYGIGTPGQVLGTENVIDGSSIVTSSKNIYGTLGNGVHVNLTPGYMLGDHFGLELGLNGFFGSKTTVSETEGPLGKSTITQSSTQFRITPALFIKSGGEKISVYARAGLLLPLLGSVKADVSSNLNPSAEVDRESKTQGKVSLGYTGAVGLNVHFGKKFGIFAEVGANSLQVKSKTTKVTKYTVGGVDQLVTEYNKKVNYVDEINSSSNTGANADPNKPQEQLRQIANFSSFFLQVGIKITFGED